MKPLSIAFRRVAAALLCLTAAAYGAALDDARRLYDRTDYAGAAALLRGAKDAPSLLLLGQSYSMMGEYKKATDTLEQAVALDPKSSVNFLWLGRAYGRRAETAFPIAAPGYASKARVNLERAVSLDPKNWDAIDDLFEYYLEAPGFLGGGTDKALKLVDLIAAHDPAEASFAQARVAEQRKEYDTAEAQFRRAAQLAPRQAGRIVDLAKFLAKRGRYEESDQTFERAFQVAPNTPKVYYSRASTLIENNRNLPEARELLKKYLSMNLTPDDPPREQAQKLLRKASGS